MAGPMEVQWVVRKAALMVDWMVVPMALTLVGWKAAWWGKMWVVQRAAWMAAWSVVRMAWR